MMFSNTRTGTCRGQGLLIALALFVAAWMPPPAATAAAPAPALLLRHVRVLDFSGPATVERDGTSVLIRAGRIVAVAPDAELPAPTDARVIDGRGQTLMPGLVDMHVHVWDQAELGAYLASGITTIRNLSGMPFHLDLQARIAAGELAAPRLITTGPILNGTGPNAQLNHQIVDTPEAARAAVRGQYAAGFRRLKVYSNLSRPAYQAIREEAARLDMTLAGHSPEGVREPGMPHQRPFHIPFETLLDDGFVTLEHMETIVWHGLRDDLDESRLRPLARRIAAAGVPVDPTLLAYYSLLRVAETRGAYLDRPGVEYLNPFISEHEAAGYARWSQEDAASARRYFEFYKRAVRIFQQEGVILVTGTDAGIFTNIPGTSLITELTLLREAGLDAHQTLRAATYNAAVALGEAESAGRVAPGFRADLILIDGDPLQDVRLAGRPSAMVVAGRYLSGEALAQRRAAAAHPPYDRTRDQVLAGLAAQSLPPPEPTGLDPDARPAQPVTSSDR